MELYKPHNFKPQRRKERKESMGMIFKINFLRYFVSFAPSRLVFFNSLRNKILLKTCCYPCPWFDLAHHKSVSICGLSFIIFFFSAGIFANPYLKIQQVRTDGYPYVKVEVSVSNLTPLENLNEANFSIFENGWKVNYFKVKKTDPEKSPKKITIAIDSSRSLNKRAYEVQIHAAELLINGILINDQVSIISFDDDVKIHCGFTSSREQLVKCLHEILQNGGKTLLYEAINKSLEINIPNQGSRNFIVIFTDGKEEKSVLKPKDIFDYTKKYPIPVFVVCAGKNDTLKDLARISHLSGGEIYKSPDVESIGKIYRLLGRLMDNTYQLEYMSQGLTEDLQNKPVRMEIRMDYADLHDQDISDFHLPTINTFGSLKKMFQDERLWLFIITACAIVILIFVLRYFATRGAVVKNIKPQEDYNPEISEKILTTSPIVKNKKVNSEKPAAGRPSAYIVEKEGPNAGRTIKLKWDNATIGHGNENTIVIDDSSVSYNHAKIELKNGEFFLYDMLSESGVYLNGKKMLRPKPLNDFDEIKIGRTTLLFRKTQK